MTVRLLLVSILCCLPHTWVQAQFRYCMSYADYQADNWVELDTLKLRGRGFAHRIRTGNDSLNKVIRDEAFAISYHDTLLINMAHMYYAGENFGNGYVPAYTFGNGQLCFTNFLPGRNDNAVFVPVGGGLVGGILSGVLAGAAVALTSSDALKGKTYCFLLKREYDGGRKEARIINDDYMKRYEKNSPEFYAEYMSVKKKKKRESATHIFPLLKDWQLIQ